MRLPFSGRRRSANQNANNSHSATTRTIPNQGDVSQLRARAVLSRAGQLFGNEHPNGEHSGHHSIEYLSNYNHYNNYANYRNWYSNPTKTNLDSQTNYATHPSYQKSAQLVTPMRVSPILEDEPKSAPATYRYHHPRKHGRYLHHQYSYEDPPSNLNKLFAESSVPGVRDIAGARNLIRKAFWLISFLILGILAMKDISQLLSEFFFYPINVNVRLRDARRLPFPAITICNLNIVRYSALCNSSLDISIPPDLKDKLCGIQTTNERPVEKPLKPATAAVTEPPEVDVANGNVADDINTYGEKVEKVKVANPPETSSASPPSSSEEGHRRTKRQWSSYVPIPHGKASGGGGGGGGGNKNNANGNGIEGDEKGQGEEIELSEREEKELQENLTNWLAVVHNANQGMTKLLGHQYDDLILRCTIKTHNCTHPNNFERHFTPTEGNCFTYKSIRKTGYKGRGRKQEEASLAGINYGLELVLNLEVSEYLPGSAQIGALVMVHHPEEFGNSASEAIFVAPQHATFIGLKMINISRLPAPYPEKCIDSWPETAHVSLTQNATYSQQACLKICLQKTIQKRCKCQSAMMPQLELNSTLKICDTRKRSIRNCVEEVMFRPEDKLNYCSCPPRCQVVMYEKTVSVSKWPTREDRVTFDRGKKDINFQNVAKVVVYFQTMTCQEVTQQGAYTTAKLFSSLGGIMGMYVGFSFLSLFEIFEVIIRRIWYSCLKPKNRFKAAVRTVQASLAMSHRLQEIQNNENNANNNNNKK